MDLDDIPEWVATEIERANQANTEKVLNVALQAAARCQIELKLASIMSTIQPNGDVVISVVKSTGEASVPYARVDRATGKITFLNSHP